MKTVCTSSQNRKLCLCVNFACRGSWLIGQRVDATCKQKGCSSRSRAAKSTGFDIWRRACALRTRATAWGSSSPRRRKASSPKSSSRKPRTQIRGLGWFGDILGFSLSWETIADAKFRIGICHERKPRSRKTAPYHKLHPTTSG